MTKMTALYITQRETRTDEGILINAFEIVDNEGQRYGLHRTRYFATKHRQELVNEFSDLKVGKRND